MSLFRPRGGLQFRFAVGLAFQFVPDGAISFDPLLIHPREHRNMCIHVIVNPNDFFAVVNPMQAGHNPAIANDKTSREYPQSPPSFRET